MNKTFSHVVAMMVGLAVTLHVFAGAVQYEYDQAGRLRRVVNPDTSQRAYTLDAAGNRTTVHSTLGNGRLQFATTNPAPVAENVGSFSIAVTRTVRNTNAAAVSYSTAPGSATSPADFTATSGTLNWAAGDSGSKTISVPIVNDTALEGPETFTITLSNPTNEAVLGSTTTVTVTINDDDAVTFSVSNLSVSEGVAGGVANVTVTKAGSGSGTFGVSYATANGSALAGQDYVATSGSLSFSTGETTKTFGVPIINDSQLESTETFTVSLSASTNGASIGAGSATVTVLDDEPLPAFSISDVTVARGGDMASFTVTKTNSTPYTHQVQYQTADGTASAGSDYGARTGSLIFTPEMTQAVINVSTTHDFIYEGNQTFYVNLSNPTNGAVLADASGMATIVEDIQPPMFAVAGSNVYESAGTASFDIVKDGSTELSHSVTYSTGGGTATGNADYVPQSGTVTFLPGETSKTLHVTILEDTVLEGTEHFLIALSNPTAGAQLWGIGPQPITIIDNEVPNSINLVGPTYIVNHGFNSASAEYTVHSFGDILTSLPEGPGYQDVGDWISPKSNMSSYEGLISNASGSCSILYNNVWHNLGVGSLGGSTFAYLPSGQTYAASYCSFRIQIRAVGGSTILATANISLQAWVGE